MAVSILLLLVGTVLLLAGGGVAVRSASRLAQALRVRPFAVAAVLFGIDLESVAVVLAATAGGQPAVAGGEAFGTVVFVFAAAFGAGLLLARGKVPAPTPTMTLVPAAGVLAMAAAAADGFVARNEGMLLVLVYAGYLAAVVREGRDPRGEPDDAGGGERSARVAPSAAVAAAGLLMLAAGAWVTVRGGEELLERTSLSAGFVGAAILAALAGVDDVLLEALPLRRGLPELATGNVLGTTAAFTTLVPGVAAILRPLQLDSAAISALLAAATLYAVVATVFLLRGYAGRLLGAAILGGYALWISAASVV